MRYMRVACSLYGWCLRHATFTRKEADVTNVAFAMDHVACCSGTHAQSGRHILQVRQHQLIWVAEGGRGRPCLTATQVHQLVPMCTLCNSSQGSLEF